MKFKDRLKLLRKGKKLTQEQLADQLGVTKRSIVNWEGGAREPSDLATIIILANFFDVTTDYLLGRTDNPKNEIIQTTFLDNTGKEHTLEIENEIINKGEKISLKEIDYLVQLLKKMGIDLNKINLSTF